MTQGLSAMVFAGVCVTNRKPIGSIGQENAAAKAVHGLVISAPAARCANRTIGEKNTLAEQRARSGHLEVYRVSCRVFLRSRCSPALLPMLMIDMLPMGTNAWQQLLEWCAFHILFGSMRLLLLFPGALEDRTCVGRNDTC